MKKIRFNDFPFGNLIKFAIEDGQRIYAERSWPTEEGYHARSVVYLRRGNRVTRKIEDDGRDCDGRLATGATYFFEAGTPKTFQAFSYDWKTGKPDGLAAVQFWQTVEGSGWQRDYQAEAAGY